MPTTTALDLITATFRKLGVHTVADGIPPEEAQEALDELNRLLESLGLERSMVFRVVELVKPLTGASTYTIGVGGDINTTRPLALRDGYTRVGTIDYPLEVVHWQQFQGIGLKSLVNPYPSVAYYDPAFPLGTVSFWPVPTSGEAHLFADMSFSSLALITETLSVPPGYKDALIYRLGKRLAPEYGLALSAEFVTEMQRCEMALLRQNYRPVIAERDPYLPGARGTDPNWIQHGGFR